MDKIVVASGNAGKIKEIKKILKDKQVVSMKEMGIDIDVEETGTTFFENALIKAKTISEILNLPVLSDDSGLEVDALGGKPGIYSARYSGLGDEQNNNKVLLEMANEKNRKARFCCQMVLYYPTGKIIESYATCEGEILTEAVGNNGFGYDVIFFSDDVKKPFGICTEEEKNSVSHRAKALNMLVEKLNNEIDSSN